MTLQNQVLAEPNMGYRAPLKDLTGQRFGKLTVVERAANREKKTMWVCRCDCGETIIVYSTHLLQSNSRSCGCGHPRREKVYNWKGCGDITGNIWDGIKGVSKRTKRSYRRLLTFEITIEYVWDLFLQQNRKCALSSVDLQFSKTSVRKETTASLDRIDSKQGYVVGNVQWVHKDINRMKNVYSQDYFIEMCRKVAETQHGVETSKNGE